MEFAQTLDIRNSRGFQAGWKIKCKTLNLIRYADDFVILHKDIKVVLQAKTIIQEWLSQVGLELKPEKTRMKIYNSYTAIATTLKLRRI